MKKINIWYLVLTAFGLIIFFYLTISNFENQSKLKEINIQDDFNIEINDAYNERGIYILNHEYYISSSTFIISNTDSLSIEDDAIWRPKEFKHILRISDIQPPFKIFKKSNNDTIHIVKSNKTIILLLETKE
jgi:hypothetical protein